MIFPRGAVFLKLTVNANTATQYIILVLFTNKKEKIGMSHKVNKNIKKHNDALMCCILTHWGVWF